MPAQATSPLAGTAAEEEGAPRASRWRSRTAGAGARLGPCLAPRARRGAATRSQGTAVAAATGPGLRAYRRAPYPGQQQQPLRVSLWLRVSWAVAPVPRSLSVWMRAARRATC